jgi:hypothetical protein
MCVSSTGAAGVDFEGTLMSAGTCTSTSTPKPAQYQDSVLVCEATTGSTCPCVPTTGAPFDARRCVLADATGNQPCPAGYPSALVFGEGIADMRTCTGCGGTPTGVKCSPGNAVPLPASCAGGGPGLTGFFGCQAASPAFGESLSVNATGGTCPQSGSPSSNGKLAPATVHAVCCTP